jgi:hypothetical protein
MNAIEIETPNKMGVKVNAISNFDLCDLKHTILATLSKITMLWFSGIYIYCLLILKGTLWFSYSYNRLNSPSLEYKKGPNL